MADRCEGTAIKNHFSCKAAGESCTVRVFWLGKELLASQNAGNIVIRQELSTLMTKKETALSRRVYQMVCGPQHSLVETDPKHVIKSEPLNEEGTIDWGEMDLILEKVCSGDEGCKLEQTVQKLFPVCEMLHQRIVDQLTEQEFEEKCGAKLEWTGCRGRLLECYSLIKSSDLTDKILSMLLLTSSLEHSLGDVYMTHSAASQCPPSLLKDLLATDELEDLLGGVAVSLLHVLIGPPSGLNLRNVLWHGFAAPGEVPSQYGFMLLLLLASFSDKLETKSFCLGNIERRPLFIFSHFEDLHGIFPEIKPDSVGDISRLLTQSFFIIPSMLPIWLKAVEYFGKGRYDFTTVLLFPLLEHGLRRVFACVNKCPERVLTAESTAFYTTFDEILASSLPNGTKNALRDEVGDSFFEMLQDLLVHPEGPRLRDHISHGEVDISSLPRELTNHILCVCVALAALFKIPEEGRNFLVRKDVALIEKISEAARTYRSVFHPISILKKKLRKLMDTLSSCHNLPKPDTDGFEYFTSFPTAASALMHTKALKSLAAGVGKELSTKLESVLYIQHDFVRSFSSLLDESVSLLFRPRNELEIVTLFRNIVQHCQIVVDQVYEASKVRYEQWQSKNLRSRQRANYKRLWTHMAKLLGSVQLIVAVLAVELTRLSGPHGNRAAYIKFLKRCLQCTENLETLSSAAKNRWDECCAVGMAMVQSVEEYYSARTVHLETSDEVRNCTVQRGNPLNAQERDKSEDAWIIIDGKVYDVTSYVTVHPGGDAILKNVGGDASEGFHGQLAHSVVRNHIARLLEGFCVGTLPGNEARSTAQNERP